MTHSLTFDTGVVRTPETDALAQALIDAYEALADVVAPTRDQAKDLSVTAIDTVPLAGSEG
ncbi:hypothetical protein ABZY93_22145 [Streptomyces smyrnaeus]|uniref:hypothetical protein n=1 Tax=Streptomyces smyrnaeus TaxID=1387713 RepID=UPI0033AE77B7